MNQFVEESGSFVDESTKFLIQSSTEQDGGIDEDEDESDEAEEMMSSFINSSNPFSATFMVSVSSYEFATITEDEISKSHQFDRDPDVGNGLGLGTKKKDFDRSWQIMQAKTCNAKEAMHIDHFLLW